jgi:hypothetical protein
MNLVILLVDTVDRQAFAISRVAEWRSRLDANGVGNKLYANDCPWEGRLVLSHSELICVKRVRGKGRGVFARQLIAEGTIIERVPVLLAPIEQFQGESAGSVLSNYCFLRNRSTVAFALGYGSLYNHSYTPNARYEEEAGALMVFSAIRAIAPGEEITINYNGEPEDQSPVGFEVR